MYIGIYIHIKECIYGKYLLILYNGLWYFIKINYVGILCYIDCCISESVFFNIFD